MWKSLFILVILTTTCWGWGKNGHEIVGQLANNFLNTMASKIATKFIGSHTLEQIAPWPDNYDHSDYGRWSGPCHYVNMPRGAANYTSDYCGSCCVVGAIMNYTNILQESESSPIPCDFDASAEPCALEFLVHFVGDVHQPLHVGYADDEGGNTVKVTFFGNPSNLHKVWDDDMILKWHSTIDPAIKELQDTIDNNPQLVQQYLSSNDPAEWADESWSYTVGTVYNGIPTLDETYYQANLPIVQQRLIAAGLRLGNLFNNVLIGSSNRAQTFKDIQRVSRNIRHLRVNNN